MTAEKQSETLEEVDQTEGEEAEDSGDASLDELLAKRSEKQPDEEKDDESMLSSEGEDRAGTLPHKVKPQQATEFVCKKCFLVKHQSQLADKRRMLCRDCA